MFAPQLAASKKLTVAELCLKHSLPSPAASAPQVLLQRRSAPLCDFSARLRGATWNIVSLNVTAGRKGLQRMALARFKVRVAVEWLPRGVNTRWKNRASNGIFVQNV